MPTPELAGIGTIRHYGTTVVQHHSCLHIDGLPSGSDVIAFSTHDYDDYDNDN